MSNSKDPVELDDETLADAKGGLNMVGIVDMHTLAEPMPADPTLENYGKDVLYGGTGHDRMVYKDD